MFLTPTLTIDLGAIVANWQLLRKKFTGDECAAVVKADAYGLGVVPVATALSKAGCDTFFVATLQEGLDLRAVLPDVRILILNGVQQGEEFALANHRLIPVLNSQAQLERWKPVAREHIHAVSALHIDTAMGRLGLQVEEFESLLAAEPGVLEACRVGLLMSHFACAPDVGHPLNAEQLALFHRVTALAPHIPASLSNSAGIFLAPENHFNLARPGCSLYGIAPQSLPLPLRESAGVRGLASDGIISQHPLTQPSPARGEGLNPMRHVATWQAPILMTRTLERTQAVGYGATVQAEKSTRIATVASGYADGYLRHLSNNAWGYVGDHRVKLLGRVTMDMLCFDVSAVPEALTEDGMHITLLGDKDGIRVDDLANAAGTIGYEILTRIGARVKRSYV